MLANAVSGEKEIRRNYIEILKELMPMEVKVIDAFHNIPYQEKFRTYGIKENITEKEKLQMIDNFCRL